MSSIKTDKIIGSVPTSPSNIEVHVPESQQILYSDSAFVHTNQFGIVFDFAQTNGPTPRQNVVARVGMSYQHAKALQEVLGREIEKAEKNLK